VVVADLGLPGMDGLELVRRLRADPVLGGTPAIALSGFGPWTQLDDALSAGYAAAFVKPVEMETLVDAIERCRPVSPLQLEPHR
jgi:CheY-like chemotaxis protein